MRPSLRLTLAAGILAAAFLVTGCGNKPATVAKSTKSTEAPSKPRKTDVSSAKPAASPTGNLGHPVQPFAGIPANPLTATAPSPSASSPGPAAGKAAPTVRRLPGRPTAAQLLAALQGTYRSFTTLKAVGSSTSLTRADGRIVGKSQQTSVSLLFARPNKVAINSAEGRFVTDGKSVYTYTPSAKRYTKGKMNANIMRELATSKPGIGVLGLLFQIPYSKVLTSLKLMDDATIGGRDVYVLSARLKPGVGCPPGVDATETIWVGKKDLGIYRSEVLIKITPKAAKGARVPKSVVTTMSSTLSSFEPNVRVSPSAFNFKPPAGARLLEQPKIVDMSNKPAADISFKWTDGTTKKLSDFRGKVVILDFWGLPVCSQQLPILQGLSEKYGRDAVLIFVNVNTKTVDVQAFLKKNHFTFPVVFADQALVKVASDSYKVAVVPTMFIIDDKGVIREQLVGGVKQKDIEAKVDKVLAR